MGIQRGEPANGPLVGVPDGRARLVTPALLVDADVLERNLRRVAEAAAAGGVALRPHVKGHKCIELARLQLAAGASGLASATLAEAELLAASGTRSLLLTSPLVDPGKIERLAALNERLPELIVVADDPSNLELLERAATTKPLSLLIDLDVGQQRTGIPVAALEQVLALRAAIDAAPGLRFAGLQAYYGHLQGLVDFAERAAKAREQQQLVKTVVEALSAEGAGPSIVSGGGTGTLLVDAEDGPFTELQPGSFPFLDRQYGRQMLTPDRRPWLEPALFVAGRVVSARQAGRVTVDAGMKAVSTDGGPPALARPADVAADYAFAGDEHGFLVLEASSPRLRLGATVELQPGHCDTTVSLHRWLHVVRGETIEAIWPIDARGYW